MQNYNLTATTDRSPNEALDNPVIELRRIVINRRKRGNLVTLFWKLFGDRRGRDRRVN
jgi:hypothetical protein